MNSYKFTLVFLSFFLFFSCKTRENLVYFQTAGSADSSSLNKNYTPFIKTDDFLSVTVTCDDVESAAPFNLPLSGNSTFNNGYLIGNPAAFGYLVDEKGEIKLPILGLIKVAGLSRMQAVALIEKRLNDYLKNPVVQIQIQNYKITVLGEVKNPGTFKIPNERITILEAIGLAGDLKPTGVRKNILVVRDVNGIKKEYRIDLTSKDIFNSSVYYLTQNDVVYVEPNPTARYESTLVGKTASIIISVTSLIITTITLITRQ
ncbi:MAG: polysaccharide biosynthesis/export family protein [Bacteroidetes bacterium]|nr:polysaccharide biosynthesis/export family protein [Bacteroidota bacterium]